MEVVEEEFVRDLDLVLEKEKKIQSGSNLKQFLQLLFPPSEQMSNLGWNFFYMKQLERSEDNRE